MVGRGDDWETPLETWQDIADHVVLPPNVTVWDPFFSTGRALGLLRTVFPRHEVVHRQEDFFAVDPPPNACIVTNPPFSRTSRILTRMLTLGVPFAILLHQRTICNQGMLRLAARYGTSMWYYIPSKRVDFIRPHEVTATRGGAHFHSVWLVRGLQPRNVPPGRILWYERNRPEE